MVVATHGNVADFYAGKSIFITGGTGFLGKVFIEKLLFSCPDIDKIYMLVREKKGETISQRIRTFFDDTLFERLKEKRPLNMEKLVPIPGDINSPNLGISYENEQTLIEKVSVVIHSAATIKFNMPLKEAWRTNVEGTRIILELTRRMQRIEVLLHISTAYSNSDREVIEEMLYPPPANIEDVHQLVKQDLTEDETLKIINKHPNTYTFTKALTEHLVAANKAYMPTVIIRPSVVAAIKNDPIKGWLQNWYGATGLVTCTARGFNRVVYGRDSNRVDLIPVDYVANLVIAAGAKNSRSRDLKIYNCCSSGCNPLPLGRLITLFGQDDVKQKILHMPFPKWYIFTRYDWIVSIVTFLFQIIPAYIVDIIRRVIGKHAIYVKLQSRAIQTRVALKYFTTHSWIMKADRTRELFSSLSLQDKKQFPFDPATIDWSEYLRDYSWGVRKFLERRK
ncbi:putative fatty acyl-CoA reductase CG5065 [Anticarsia gemmatalis]|uniref:putative fatty acyl-CoA reductase CG5065 n=1 Tax=Anticarsia gemmatalis TaxID=129554 RepID=UPI003F7743E2